MHKNRESVTESDEKIIGDIRAGNPRRYSVLLDRHKDRAMTLALRLAGNRHEAEELVQDAFVRAYNNLNQFRGDAKFSTWFYRILYNVCMTKVTRRHPAQEMVDVDDTTLMDKLTLPMQDGTPLERMEDAELQEIIRMEIDALPEKYRTHVTLFYVQEMSYEQIGEVLGLPVGTVKTNLFRARTRLRASVLLRLHDGVKVA